MKLRVVSRKVYDYIRYDLKEIAFPSSLPDPPGTIIRPKLTWKQRYEVSFRNSYYFCTVVSNNCGCAVVYHFNYWLANQGNEMIV